MVIAFPFFEVTHEGIMGCKVVALDTGTEPGLPPLVLMTRRAVSDVCIDFKYRIYGVDKREYVSNSGLHAFEPVNIEPVISTPDYDFYVVEYLDEYVLLPGKAKRRPKLRDEACKKAIELYLKQGRGQVLPDCLLLWRVRDGYAYIILAKRVETEEFIKAAEEYALLLLFNAV